MKGFFERIFSMNHNVVNFFMFLAAALILILFFPRGGKFKYEYQKGKPWMHEVLHSHRDHQELKQMSSIKNWDLCGMKLMFINIC